MSISRRQEVLTVVGDTGVLPLFYSDQAERSVHVMAALGKGGARAIEFTDRGPNARRVFAEMAARAAVQTWALIRWVTLARLEWDTPMRRPASFQVVPSQEPQP
jgi:hypothetical protein